MKNLFKIFAVLLALSIGFFSITTPEQLPIGLLVVPVFLIFALVGVGSFIVLKLANIHKNREKHQKIWAVIIGATAAFFLVFQSTGGIVVGDIILMVLILAVTYVYIARY